MTSLDPFRLPNLNELHVVHSKFFDPGQRVTAKYDFSKIAKIWKFRTLGVTQVPLHEKSDSEV